MCTTCIMYTIAVVIYTHVASLLCSRRQCYKPAALLRLCCVADKCCLMLVTLD